MLQGRGEIFLVKEEEAILDWKPETERLSGYIKFKGIGKTEFCHEYLKAGAEAQEYLGRYTAKELLKLLGVESQKIKKAELLVLPLQNEALLDFRLKDVDWTKAMELKRKFLEIKEKLQDPAEAEKLVSTAFDAIKVKSEQEAQRYGAFRFGKRRLGKLRA